MGWCSNNDNSTDSDSDSDNGGFVTTTKTDGGTNTVIVTGSGATTYRCPGGLTEDDLLD